jgi:hypothetical protein
MIAKLQISDNFRALGIFSMVMESCAKHKLSYCNNTVEFGIVGSCE